MSWIRAPTKSTCPPWTGKVKSTGIPSWVSSENPPSNHMPISIEAGAPFVPQNGQFDGGGGQPAQSASATSQPRRSEAADVIHLGVVVHEDVAVLLGLHVPAEGEAAPGVRVP